MEVLTEMDEYFNAMAKINMNESVMPYVNGRLVDSGTYNKVQKILNTPELEKAHMFCYDLDLENLDESDISKVNNLYKLGVDRGFIDDDLQYQDDDEDCDDTCQTQDADVEVAKPAVRGPRYKIPCFVAMYSAMKDGQIKTGEAYSKAISVQAAKADVIAQLSRFGYSNISILAIEATEEDACCSSVCDTPDSSSIAEDDLLDGRVHNNHLSEAENEDDAKEDGDEESDTNDSDSDDSSDNQDTDSDEDDSSSEDTDDADDTDDNDATDDSGDDSEDDSAEEPEDDSAETSDGTEGEDAEDDSNDSDDSTAEDSEDDSDDSDDSEDSEDSDDEEDSDSEDSDDEDADEDLDDNKKSILKDSYRKAFRSTMLKCKFDDKSFDDLTIDQKVKFFTELAKVWKDEGHEPNEFMSDKEIAQLNKIVVKN